MILCELVIQLQVDELTSKTYQKKRCQRAINQSAITRILIY